MPVPAVKVSPLYLPAVPPPSLTNLNKQRDCIHYIDRLTLDSFTNVFQIFDRTDK
jgi:hypothetical protein